MSQRPRPLLPRVMLVSIAIAGLVSFLVVAVGCDNIIIISTGSSSSSPSKPPAQEGELEFELELDHREPLDVSLSATVIHSGELLEAGGEVPHGIELSLSVNVNGSGSNQTAFDYRWYINTELQEGEAESTITLVPELLEIGPVTITVLVMGDHVIGSDSMRFRVIP